MLIKLQIYSYGFLLVNKIMKPTPGVEPIASNLLSLMVSTLARQVKGPGFKSWSRFNNFVHYPKSTRSTYSYVYIRKVCVNWQSLETIIY